MKRYRAPKAKPGQIKVQWGKLPDDNPDLCFAWGDGIPHPDVCLLQNALAGKHYSLIDKKWDIGLLEELERRGYDITTLKISISKKEIQQVSSVEPL